ncbi:MAG: PIG-L deacetylase family protein [Steroidobacteraceae bacterium]|jgi:LmbE family N-acetylglucosaminyl deacetylase|nr:PIG-L deacetylase family protein [Steroidobacteraceae bacterium]
MLSWSPGAQLRHVLCLGAHCDDIEIGCLGTLMTLAGERPDLRFTIAVFASDELRRAETENALRAAFTDESRVTLKAFAFRDGYFPAQWSLIKECIEQLKRDCEADLVLTHWERDRHQDHRTLCELAWNTFRDHPILEYEIPKYDGDLGRPNVFVPLTAGVVQRKVDTLLESFPSQAGKRWFTADLFRGVMRIRGMECNAPSGFAEAFHARKIRLLS